MIDAQDYRDHLQILMQRCTAALELSGHAAVLFGAGIMEDRFLDDQPIPFRANPHLLQWLPLLAHPGSLLLFQPGEAPIVAIVRDDDYWHLPPAPPGPPWEQALEIREASDAAGALRALGKLPEKLALIGPPSHWQALGLPQAINPPHLLDALHYPRAVKTPYEIAAMRVATQRAVAGHRAAADAFHDGATEFDILLAFLGAARQAAHELPYPAIVAGDRHGAVLHYQHYDQHSPARTSLLIDAGCQHLGYASDITRTYAAVEQHEFAELVAAMEELQQGLCNELRPGLWFGELHALAHARLAALLAATGLIQASADTILAGGATGVFLPHGLGHLLGVQVHDVGGHLADITGRRLEPPADYPRLRLLRTLEPGQVLTIEPGLYFIDSLLEKLRQGPLGQHTDWAKVDRLRACGGIRIEDNLLVTDSGAENLTREAFAA